MRILFWVPYPTEGPSNRYRVEQYLPYLEEKGIRYCLRPFWRSAGYKILYKKGYYFQKIYFFIFGSISRLIDLLSINSFDAVFIHREAYPLGGPIFEKLLRVFKKPFVFDFDDAIFMPTISRHNTFIARFKRPQKALSIIKMSKYVIAGNRYLADFALKYNSSVVIIPTSIDTDRYFPVPNKSHREIIIGWSGSVTTQDFLNSLNNVFRVLFEKYKNVKLKIVGGQFSLNDCTNNIENKPWVLKDEIEDLRSFDIGIMPMPDSEWSKGKCGFKAILYMSMGIPAVCSAVGVNKEIITDGVNGFLADSKEEWIKKLSLLIENPKLRQQTGLLGRETVVERYSLKASAPFFLDIIRKVYKETNVK